MSPECLGTDLPPPDISLSLSLSCLCLFCSASPSGYLTWSVMGEGQHGGDYTDRYCCVRCTHQTHMYFLQRVHAMLPFISTQNTNRPTGIKEICVVFVCVMFVYLRACEVRWKLTGYHDLLNNIFTSGFVTVCSKAPLTESKVH